MTPSVQSADAPNVSPARKSELRAAAEGLEAAFLSEMLKSAGMDARQGAFGGGVGEDQFASLLRDEQSRRMVEAGGIGLAEQLYRTLVAREVRQ